MRRVFCYCKIELKNFVMCYSCAWLKYNQMKRNQLILGIQIKNIELSSYFLFLFLFKNAKYLRNYSQLEVGNVWIKACCNHFQKIEFRNGELTSYIQFAKNKVKNSKYSFLNIIPSTLLFFIRRSCMLFLIFLIILNFVLDYKISPLTYGFYLVPFLISILINIVENLYFQFYNIKRVQKINEAKCSVTIHYQKCNKENDDEQIRSQELKVGDVIYLRRGDIVPADIILLDSLQIKNREAITYVDTNLIDGRINTTKKKVIIFYRLLTLLNCQQELLKKIIGPNTSDKYQNFILAGSIIKTSGWIFGMVVYAGMQTKIRMNSCFTRKKYNILECLIEKYYYLFYFIYILVSLLMSLIFVYSEHKNKQLITFHLWSVLASYLILNSSLINLMIYTFIDISQLINLYRLKKSKIKFNMYDPTGTIDFSTVDYALFDKTGTLTSGKYEISQIVTQTSQYLLDLDKLKQSLQKDKNSRKERESRNFISQQSNRQLVRMKSTEVYQNEYFNKLQIDQNFHFKNFCEIKKQQSKPNNFKTIHKNNLERLQLGNKHFLSNLYSSEIQINQILVAFTICHQAQMEYNNKLGYFTSHSAVQEEQVFHQFARTCGWYVQRPQNLQNRKVIINGIIKSWIIVGINSFSYNRKRMSVVYKESQLEGESILLCKGHPQKLLNLLKLPQEQIDKLEEILGIYNKKGIKPVMFTKRKLDKVETQVYSKDYWKLKYSLISNQQDFQELAQKYEKNLQFVCILGLRDKFNEGSQKLIQMLYDRNVKCWMLTGDSKQSAINIGKKMRVKKIKNISEHHIFGSDQENINSKISNFYAEIKMLISPNKIILDKDKSRALTIIDHQHKQEQILLDLEIVLLISGSSLNLIQRDQYMLQHFIYACTFCDTLIGYNLTPTHKQFFVKMIKQQFPQNNTVLAIGDGVNDTLMMQAADISIQLLNVENNNSSLGGDISVQQIESVGQLFMANIQSYANTFQGILILLYSSLSIGVVLLLYNVLNQYIGVLIVNSPLLFMNTIILPLFFAFTIQVMKNPSEEISKEFPALYAVLLNNQDNQKSKNNSFKIVLCEVCIQALLHGIQILVFSYYGLKLIIVNNDSVNIGQMAIVISLSLAYTHCMKTFNFIRSKNVLTLVLMIILTTAIIFVIILIDFGVGYSLYFNYQSNLTKLFSSYYSIAIIFINVTLNTVITLLHNIFLVFFEIRFFTSACIRFNQEKIKTNSQLLNFIRSIKQQFCVISTFSQCARYVFRNSKEIDNSILQSSSFSLVINPVQTNLNELKMTKFLNVSDSSLQIRLRIQQSKNGIFYFRIVLLIIFIWLIALEIQESVLYYDSQAEIIFLILAYAIVLLGIIAASFSYYFQQKFFVMNKLVIGLIVLFKIVYEWVSSHTGFTLINVAVHMLITINIKMELQYVLFFCIISSVSFIAKFIHIYYVRPQLINNLRQQTSFQTFSIYVIFIEVILVQISIVLNFKFLYNIRKEQNSQYLAKLNVEKETQHTEDILGMLVPKFVQRQIQKRKFTMQKPEQKVSVLFSYVCNFDLIIKEEGKKVVCILDQLFRQFDQLCPGYGVQKIETVGMTYMAATGIKACQDQMDSYILYKQQTQRILNMAYAMIDKTKGLMFGKNKDKQLKIKVGIHTGRVIAGVIGHHKPQFSLIGDTVNITSRHCSKGQPGDIVLSQVAYQKVKNILKNVVQDRVKMKGLNKGNQITIYRVKREKPTPKKSVEKFRNAMRQLVIQSNIVEKKTINVRELLLNFNQLKISIEDQEEQSVKKEFINTQNQIRYEESQSESIVQEKDVEINQEQLIKPQPFLLYINKQFYSSQQFIKILMKHNYKKCWHQWLLIIILYICMIILILAYSTMINLKQLKIWLIVIPVVRGIIIFLMILVFIFQKLLYENILYRVAALIIWILMIASCFLIIRIKDFERDQIELSNKHFQIIALIESSIYLFSAVSIIYLFNFIDCIILTLLGYIVPWFGVCFQCNFISYYFYVGVISSSIIISSRTKYMDQIKNFNTRKINQAKKIEEKALVSQLLPTHAFLKLKSQKIQNKLQLTDQFQNVTILFADIQGFTAYSNRNRQQPQKVVDMLRKLFTGFDKQCLRFNVYKLYTIGDCYVVMGFTNACQRDYITQALNTIKLAAEMILIIKKTREAINFPELNMRIGIHTGNIIGGIIGTQIVRYDIYGSDVLIANKFQQNGTPSQIHISQTTKTVLDKYKDFEYNYIPNGNVHIEKLGVSIPGYLLQRKE